jgi:hypothetical protein
MSHKLLTAFCALVLVLGLSFGAKAEVQNVKVGGSINLKGIYQDAYDVYSKVEVNNVEVYRNNDPALGAANASTAQDFLINTVEVYVDAALTDNVDAYVLLTQDRDWGLINDPADDVEAELVYLTLNDMYGYPFTLCLGRQNLLYGEGFLVGDGNRLWPASVSDDTVNMTYQYDNRKAFDAIKAVWNYEPHQIDIFTAKTQEAYFNNTDRDLYGINWNIDGGMYGIWDAGLFWAEQNPATVGTNETIALSVRGEGTLPQITTGTLALKGEIVKEWGEVAAGAGPWNNAAVYQRAEQERRNAWGGYLEGEYTFDNPYAPYFGVGYIYMSGDKEPDELDGNVEEFDPMFEDERYGEIAEVIYGQGATAYVNGFNGMSTGGETSMTNARIWKLSGGFNPTENTNIDLTYYKLTADQKVYSQTQRLGEDNDADDQNKDIGDEFDLTFTYDYTEDVSFGLLYAVFNPGNFFEMGADEVEANDMDISLDRASELLGSVKVTF